MESLSEHIGDGNMVTMSLPNTLRNSSQKEWMNPMTASEFHQSAEEFECHRFIVYGILNQSRDLIYIGSGSIGRAGISLRDKCGSGLLIVKCNSREEAYSLEAELILKFLPERNVFIPKSNGRPSKKIRNSGCNDWRKIRFGSSNHKATPEAPYSSAQQS